MDKEKLKKAKELESMINVINSVMAIIENKNKDKLPNYKVGFGVSFAEHTSYHYPVPDDLTAQLAEVTKKYCAEKLVELEKEFHNL